MTKNKFAIFLDTFGISTIIFILSFIWAYKIIKNAIFCFFICILISIVAFLLIYRKQLKKNKILKIKSSELNFAKKCYENIINLTDFSLDEFYEKLFSAKKIKQNIFKNSNSIFYINLKKQLDINDFIYANSYYLESDKTLALSFIGNGYSNEFVKMLELSTSTYNTYDQTEIFLLMKENNIFPISNTTETKSNIFKFSKVKNKLETTLTKNKFKDFFISGLSLITLSIFIPYSLYYLICGSLLLIFSIICLFSKSKIPEVKNKPNLNSLTEKKDAK